MKILIDIGHPAHVHFFANPIRIWREAGCEIFITSRRKEIATDLLDALKIPHEILSSLNQGTVTGMAQELWQRDRRLYRVIKREKPDILVGIGGVFIAHAGFLTRTPSIVFYDTENAHLSNLITYPFCSRVVVPACYQSWLPPWHLRYPGYHELSYLHPNQFSPDRTIALQCGLDPQQPTFLIRTVSWQASHDLREQGWSPALLNKLIAFLAPRGKVIISSEVTLPPDLAPYAYTGPPEQMHHLLGHLNLFIGESATMASECAVMGVPAIYAAETGRGYTDEQEQKYGLIRNIRELNWPNLERNITEMLATPDHVWMEQHTKLLDDTIDVARFVADLILGYPGSVKSFKAKFKNGSY
ncbi:DUF354 domain-containing protein [Thermodesulfobacteriota bacterium]